MAIVEDLSRKLAFDKMQGFDYRFETLQKALEKESNEDIVQQYLLDPFPFCFLSNPELYRDLRRQICLALEIHAQDFAIVGSGKLGFSLSPKKVGAPFSDASDIDVLIVSSELFERVWLDLINYRKKVFFRLNSLYRQV